MSVFEDLRSHPSAVLSDEDLIKLAAEELPRWKAACDHPEGEVVLLNQRAFGKSASEMLLLGAPIKYAGIAGKDVTVGAATESPADAGGGLAGTAR
jgi:hypothetical protein